MVNKDIRKWFENYNKPLTLIQCLGISILVFFALWILAILILV